MAPSPSRNTFLLVAALSGLLAVALGAFGAHALEDRLSAAARSVYETAVHYHFVHTLALLAVGTLSRGTAHGLLRGAGLAFILGLLLFSGSLYALSMTGIRWLGAITPLGGLSFMLGWGLLFAWAWRGERP
ncbi:MAG: DUF423 domain-containing protein [Halieaceae bacterium]|jgi:uncharacterized membrane protein YgdD (TMEM256/DUF423 family)|nr:DUF423 domain-containing protein [Halieaceae bacterium]